MPIDYIKPVIDESVRNLCFKPYHNHPKGCPNFGKRDTCPPKAVLLTDYLDINKPIMVVWVEYNLGLHRARAKAKHSHWTKQQCENSRHWQNSVRARLRRDVKDILVRNPLFEGSTKLVATDCPEAMGVNVTETMKNIGVILEWPPENIVRIIAFIGTPPAAKKPCCGL